MSTKRSRLADRIVVMREGRVEQVAPPLELFERPATHYVRELVHAGDDVYRHTTCTCGIRCVDVRIRPPGASPR